METNIRLESFDKLNPHKRKILALLKGREFGLREITEAIGKSKSANWSALQFLLKLGLIVPNKSVKDKHWSDKVQKVSRDKVRYLLSQEGLYAIEYFKNFPEVKEIVGGN